jgi:hypothetical protein
MGRINAEKGTFKISESGKGAFKILGRTLIRLSVSRENIFHGHGDVRRFS